MFRLPDAVQERIRAAEMVHSDRKRVFGSLDNQDLAASARFWMQHCDAPRRLDPSASVYDSTMWHVILPELIRRVEAAAEPASGR